MRFVTHANSSKAHNTVQVIYERLNTVRPKDALAIARAILETLNEGDYYSYGNFESAQAVERHVRKAVKELEGLPLA